MSFGNPAAFLPLTLVVFGAWLREKKGIKAGCLNVYCFRPFPATYIVDALKNAKAVTVIERMDDPLAQAGVVRRVAAVCARRGGGAVEELWSRVAGIPRPRQDRLAVSRSRVRAATTDGQPAEQVRFARRTGRPR